MKKQKYYIKNDDFQWEEIDDEIAQNVLSQYFERRYVGALILASFIIGFLLGIIAYAI